MKYLLLFLFMSLITLVHGQSPKKMIRQFQKELNSFYKSPDTSPLSTADRKVFKRHMYFPINMDMRVEARFERLSTPETIDMETSTTRVATYDRYGVAIFELGGKTYQLTIYQSHRLREQEEYKDHLFLPYQDLTNGVESYGGGRYIDLKIPKGDTIVIDFNQSYHPYCAYSDGYSCPVPPLENRLDVRIEAGIRL